MKNRLKITLIKSKLAAKNLFWLLTNWKYSASTIVISVLFFELIYWLFNLTVLLTIVLSPNVTFFEKIMVLSSPIEAIYGLGGLWLVIVTMLLSLMQGIIISALIYIIKVQKKIDDQLVGSTSFVTMLAIIGLGCPACGTSLIAPIVAIFASSSAVVISEQITAIASPIALIFALYGTYQVGLKIANVKAKYNI